MKNFHLSDNFAWYVARILTLLILPSVGIWLLVSGSQMKDDPAKNSKYNVHLGLGIALIVFGVIFMRLDLFVVRYS